MTGARGTDILPILLLRKRALLLSGIATACVTLGMSLALPVTYVSEGSLIIDQQPSAMLSPTGPSVLTEVDLLQSKGLIRRSVTDFKLADVPGLEPGPRLPALVLNYLSLARDSLKAIWRSITSTSRGPGDDNDELVAYIEKHLQVEAREKSTVISVAFAAGTADAAAKVVNAILGTYLSAIDASRRAQVAKTDEWIASQMSVYARDIATAEQRVTKFVQAHNLTEVQGSLTAAIQLAKYQEQLAVAREDLIKREAALDTVQHGGLAGAQETLEAKTIQSLKEAMTRITAQMNMLAQFDPRRGPLQSELNSVILRLKNENDLIYASLARDVQVAQARVRELETLVGSVKDTAQDSSVAGATLKQLTGDLEGKRQLYVAFLTQASQMRIAVMQAPTAHLLFRGLPPDKAARSFGVLALILGFFAGITGAASVIASRTILGTKVNSRHEMAEVTGLSVFGCLPDVRTRTGNILEPPRTASMVTETFRAMWLTIRPQQESGIAILITSSDVGEGKTTVAVALARRFADDGQRVLLIDADLRQPRLSAALGLRPVHGLKSVLDGKVSLKDAVLSTGQGLDCLIADGQIDNPVKTLSSSDFANLLTTCQHFYDFVILDSPPVLHVADPLLLGKLCQRIVFIVQAGRLSGVLIDEAIQRFTKEDRDKILPILNRVPSRRLGMQGYYSGYT